MIVPRLSTSSLPPLQRIAESTAVDAQTKCWVWTSTRDSRGYGRLMVDGRRQPAHRFAYETLAGPIPEGYELDHVCRNRACVNPAHLDVVTHAENMGRSTGYPRHQKAPSLPTRPPTPAKHGTLSMYVNHKCRCAPCVEANTKNQRAYRAARSIPAGDPRHGSVNGYTNYGCRCEPCIEAKKAAYVRYKRKA